MGHYLTDDEIEGWERWVKRLMTLAGQTRPQDNASVYRLLGYIKSAELWLDEPTPTTPIIEEEK